MTNKEIIEDFTVFYLCQYEELLSKVIWFFNQKPSPDPFNKNLNVINNYFEFIRQYINIDEVINNEFKLKEITNINDVVTDKELQKLVSYLDDNFRWGYPDDFEDGFSFGGSLKLDVTEMDLVENFNNTYLELHKINPNVYISYLYQFFGYDNDINSVLKDVIKKFDQLSITINTFTIIEKGKIEEQYEKIYEKKMLDSILDNPFQFYGFVDKKGFSINKEQSFKNWVIASKGMNLKYEFDSLSSDLIGTDYLIYKYFRYKFYEEKFLYGTNEKVKSLSLEFQTIKDTNRDLINFLKKKGFDSDDCDTILNVLLNNKFSELNLRSIPYISKPNQLFRFCYLFFIFDFFEEVKNIDFSRENDFQSIKIDNKYSLYNSSYDKQFYKYKKNVKSHIGHSNSPFKSTVEITIRNIESKLEISRGKLKKY